MPAQQASATFESALQPRNPGRATRARVALFTFCRTKPLAAFAGLLVLLVFAVAISADVLATYDPNRVDPAHRLQTPNATHLLGTDNLGRDIYSRVLHGSRATVFISVSSVLLAAACATVLGGVSGFIGGKLDLATQRVVDIMLSFPPLVLLLSIVHLLPHPTSQLVIGPLRVDSSIRTGVYLAITLGLLLSLGMSRVIRSSVITVKHSLYVEAAASIGAGRVRVFCYHTFPNIFPIILTAATSLLGAAILVEASISFLGFGLPPDIPSWGIMLNEGQKYIARSVNITLWPGLAIFLAVFGFNMLGDGLRDTLDPRLRRE